MLQTNDILDLWFGKDRLDYRSQLWWNGILRTDTLILNSIRETDIYLTKRWGAILDELIKNPHFIKEWSKTVDDKMAILILIDQFARNIYRGKPESFYFTNEYGRSLAEEILREPNIPYTYTIFCYIAMMHTENLLTVIEAHLGLVNMVMDHPDHLIGGKIKLIASACEEHCKLLERFGRYPHRNTILGRHSIPKEVDYLSNKIG